MLTDREPVTRLPLAPLSERPLVSIVIPAYQAQDYIIDAIESVQASTYSRWQCVVVDDGSTDDTYRLVAEQSAADPRITVVHKDNAGPLSCLNAAAPIVEGSVVFLLDADDLLLPTKIETVVDRLQADANAGFAVHRLAVCDRDLRMVGISPVQRALPHGDHSEAVLRSRRGVPGLGVSSAFCLRSEVFAALFPAGFTTRRFPDEYVRRCAPLVADLCAVDVVLGIRRIHDENLTGGRVSFADEVRRSKDDHSRLADALSDFAARYGYADRLAPRSEDVDLLLLEWLTARLSGRNDWRVAWRRLTRARGYAVLPWSFRLYWRLACHTPRPVFRSLMATASRSDRLRLLVNYVASRRRDRTLDHLPDRVSLRTVVRLAAGRH